MPRSCCGHRITPKGCPEGRVSPREGLPRGKGCPEGLPRRVVPKICAEGVIRRLPLLGWAFLFSEHQASLHMQHGAPTIGPWLPPLSRCLPVSSSSYKVCRSQSPLHTCTITRQAVYLRLYPPRAITGHTGSRLMPVQGQPFYKCTPYE